MTEQKTETLHKKQSAAHPELLDTIEECLAGDVKQTALDFVDYCKANKMPIRWGATYQWYVYYKSKHIACISLRFKGMVNGSIGTRVEIKENSCHIQLSYLNAESPAFEDFIKRENLSEVIWKNVKHCQGCLKTCVPRERTILGRKFDGVAICNDIWFQNPDAAALGCIKELLDTRRAELGKGGVPSGMFYR